MIVSDFRTAINLELPSIDDSVVSTVSANPFDAEIAMHRGYAINKARFFAGREKVCCATV